MIVQQKKQYPKKKPEKNRVFHFLLSIIKAVKLADNDNKESQN